MRINADTCIVCGLCLPTCPQGAISMGEGAASIDLERCVECGTCRRVSGCPTDAIEEQPLDWPRSLRSFYSDPVTEHKETGIPGRGTEEMKTNDVTRRYGYGEVGFSMEIGRPTVGTRFSDVEKVAKAMARLGVEFEPLNPLTFLMKSKGTGELKEGVKEERVLSAIIEFKVPMEKAGTVLDTLRSVARELDTVLSVGVACRVLPDGSIPVAPILERSGVEMQLSGKVNMGLGRR